VLPLFEREERVSQSQQKATVGLRALARVNKTGRLPLLREERPWLRRHGLTDRANPRSRARKVNEVAPPGGRNRPHVWIDY
jgi:hypothetical protein